MVDIYSKFCLMYVVNFFFNNLSISHFFVSCNILVSFPILPFLLPPYLSPTLFYSCLLHPIPFPPPPPPLSLSPSSFYPCSNPFPSHLPPHFKQTIVHIYASQSYQLPKEVPKFQQLVTLRLSQWDTDWQAFFTTQSFKNKLVISFNGQSEAKSWFPGKYDENLDSRYTYSQEHSATEKLP